MWKVRALRYKCLWLPGCPLMFPLMFPLIRGISMQRLCVSSVFSLLLTPCLCTAGSAQQTDGVESMKLIAPSVGWAATGSRVPWTADGGSNWNDWIGKQAHHCERRRNSHRIGGHTDFLTSSVSRDLSLKRAVSKVDPTTAEGRGMPPYTSGKPGSTLHGLGLVKSLCR